MKTRVLCVLLLIGVFAIGAYATPISYISATTVPTSFNAGTGIFSLEGVRPLIVHYTNGVQLPFAGGTISMITTLASDNSTVDGRVSGLFNGGTISIKDAGGVDLLSGSVNDLTVSEVFDNIGILAANGTFTPTSGSLLNDFGSSGLVYQIIFQVDPAAIDNLTVSLSGLSNLSLAPVVPEPITLGLLSLGLAGLAAYRRKRS